MSELYGSSGGYDRGDSGGSGTGDYSRFPGTRSPVGKVPHFYDGDIQEALARDTSPNRYAAYDDDDPDLENYAHGNDPEAAWRMQGRPDSPDSWAGYGQGDGPDTGQTGDPLDLWGETDPDLANYADLYGQPASPSDRAGGGDQPGPGPANYGDRGEEPDRGMNRAEYAAYSRTRESGSYPADGYDPCPDAENCARGLTPDIAWRNQGNPDSPNGWASYTSRDHDERDPDGATRDPGDMWGGTYPDAASHTGTDAEVRDRIASIDELGSDLAPTLTSASDLPDSTAEDRVLPDERQYSDAAGDCTDRSGSASTEATETDSAIERIAQLESANHRLQSENADLGKAVAELRSENTRLGKSVEALESRLERLEQNRDDNLAVKTADSRTRGGLVDDGARAKQEQGKKGPSDEAVILELLPSVARSQLWRIS